METLLSPGRECPWLAEGTICLKIHCMVGVVFYWWHFTHLWEENQISHGEKAGYPCNYGVFRYRSWNEWTQDMLIMLCGTCIHSFPTYSVKTSKKNLMREHAPRLSLWCACGIWFMCQLFPWIVLLILRHHSIIAHVDVLVAKFEWCVGVFVCECIHRK